MIATIILLLFLCLLLFHVYTRHNRSGRLYNKIPGPKPYPVIGNMLTFLTSDPQYLWEVMRAMFKQHYPIMRLWGIDTAIVNICHPDDLEILLTSQKTLQKGFAYWYLEPWLKTGLLTSTDDKWRQRRKILTPAFHFGILKKYAEIMSEHGAKMIEALRQEGRESVKSLMPFCSTYTLNIICESTLGSSLAQVDAGKFSEYEEAIRNMGKVFTYKLVRPYIPEFFLPLITDLCRLQTHSLKILHDFTDKIIKERKEYHEKNENKYLIEYANDEDENVYIDSDKGKKRLAMLDLLLTAEKKGLIDCEGIQEEVDTFTFEGHDTSGMAMAYTLLLLAENQEAQEKARAEVSAVIDRSEGKVGMAEAQEFNYLERCIKESLRLYPPVSTIMRIASQDIQLKHALIPSGAHVMIHFWDTHRDPNFWPEPDKFEPDRFSAELCKARHPFAYMPFSAGPRNCIGQKFAMTELKLLIGRILHEFRLEAVSRLAELKLKADIILRPSEPVHLRLVRLAGPPAAESARH